jgi:putative membrane protein
MAQLVPAGVKRFALGVALASSFTSLAAAASSKSEAYVAAAGHSDQYEIQAGRLVVTQSQNERVRAFGQQMIDHHMQTHQALAQATSKAGAPPPPDTLDGDQQRMLSALQSLRGADLDRAYVTQQVNAHVSALVTQQAYAASGDDPDLKAAARSAVPVIQSHLDVARQMKTAMPEQ